MFEIFFDPEVSMVCSVCGEKMSKIYVVLNSIPLISGYGSCKCLIGKEEKYGMCNAHP